MTGFDFGVLAVLVLSSLVGFARGLLKEILALFAYGLAAIAAFWYGPPVYVWLESWIETSLVRLGLAYVTVFLLVLLAAGLINMLLSTLIHKSGFSSADRGLGAVFGLVRGGLIVLLLVTVAGYTPLPKESWWRNAWSSSMVVETIQYSKTWLPSHIASLLPY